MTTRHVRRFHQLSATCFLALLTVACGGEDELTEPSEPSEPPNEAPTATIQSPDDGALFQEDEEIHFEGSADDPEEVELPGEEFDALVALYESTDGDGWNTNDGWLDEEQPPSRWHGVEVDDGHVVELELETNNLHGTLPPDLGDLGDLERLDLSGNNLTGEIPPELGHLERLRELTLHQNDLTGEVPPRAGEPGGIEHTETQFQPADVRAAPDAHPAP